MANYEYHSIKPVNLHKNMSFADYLKNKNFVHKFVSSKDIRTSNPFHYQDFHNAIVNAQNIEEEYDYEK